MPVIKIQTNFNIDLEFEAAEFPRRLAAWIIDLIIQIFYLVIAGKILSSFRNGESINIDDQYDSWAISLLFILPFFLYHVVCEITMTGQSVGKKLLKIRVVNENGGKASISQYLIRWLIRTSDLTILIIIIYLPYAAVAGPQVFIAMGGAFLLLLLDFILTVSSKKAQRLGDLLAGTILIRTNPKGNINDTVFLEIADNYVPSFPQIMQLSDRDINSIKSILDTSRKKGDFQLAAMATEKIKSHLKIDSSLSPFDFLEIVMKDYNYLSTK
ncbi:MAG: RDD family protein [Chitinophagaceae bacterium]